MRKLSLLLFALLLSPVAASAQPAPAVDRAAHLSALGGVAFGHPGWHAVREEAAVAVYEQAADPASGKPFYVLVVAVEEGPRGEPDWAEIRDNIVEAASKEERKLTLEVGEALSFPGFKAQAMSGTFVGAADQRVTLELVAMVAEEKLVTVSLISDERGEASGALLSAVAATVKLNQAER